MRKSFVFLIFALVISAVNAQQFITKAQPSIEQDHHFKVLSTTWDEGIPLGNGMVGALVWQKGNNLRMS